MWPASGLAAVRTPQLLTTRSLHRLAQVYSWHGFPRMNDPRKPGGSGNVFYDLTLGVTGYQDSPYFIGHTGQP